jgi:hypothetical protein
MTPEYLKILEDAKLRPTVPSALVKEHQPIQCLLCSSTFTATPHSKVMNYRKWGSIGCPKCSLERKNNEVRTRNIAKLSETFDLLDPVEVLLESNVHTKIHVRNKTCGHDFNAKMNNLLAGLSKCPTCNALRKRELFQQFNIDRVEEVNKYRTPFLAYKADVYNKTRHTYNANIETLNPHGYERIVAEGGKEGYHLDHIVSISKCFHAKVPSELCAHLTNLRLIPWQDNCKKRTHIHKHIPIPDVLKKYFPNLS